MEFDTFLNLLAKIADMKYSNADSSAEALSLLLQNHFLPLYDNIINETDLGEDEIKFKEEIDEGTLMLVKNIQSILQKIYLVSGSEKTSASFSFPFSFYRVKVRGLCFSYTAAFASARALGLASPAAANSFP